MELLPKPARFSKIKEVAPSWLAAIPGDTIVQVFSIPFGEKILDSSGMSKGMEAYKDCLGIILDGEAELFDCSTFDGVVAYRPIRMLGKKDIFGDFSFMDEYAESNKSPSRPGETWSLVAGRRCLLLGSEMLHNIPKPKQPLYRNGNTPVELFNFVKKVYTGQTQVAFLKFEDINLEGEQLIAFFKDTWKRVKTYRDGINSYNFQKVLEFRAKVIRMAKEMGLKLPITTIVPALADALFDTLNRPLRSEPIFTIGLPKSMSKAIDALQPMGINSYDILISSSMSEGEFYFPIDIHNYFFNVSMHFEVAENDDKKRTIGNQLDSTFPRKTGTRTRTKNTPCVTLIEALLESSSNTDKQYPYIVTCKMLGGATRGMLLLHFKPKGIL